MHEKASEENAKKKVEVYRVKKIKEIQEGTNDCKILQ